MSTNHVVFLTNRFPRLISLPMSAIFVSGTSGITAILKYGRVNPILYHKQWRQEDKKEVRVVLEIRKVWSTLHYHYPQAHSDLVL